MEQLPCGHTPDTKLSAEDKTRPHLELVDALIAALKKGKLTPSSPLIPTYQTERISIVKNYFRYLKKRVQKKHYLDQVRLYEQANRVCFDLPACCRQSMPLLPDQVPGLLREADLSTPRSGGRPTSQKTQERNARIAELKRARHNYRAICRVLHEEKWPVPSNWHSDDVRTWRQAATMKRDNVQSLFSKAASQR